MPVPKRKTSKSRRDKRSSTKFIRPRAFAICSNCDNPVNPHQACFHCGFYKGRRVLATKVDRALKRDKTKKTKVKEVEDTSKEPGRSDENQ